MKSIKIEGGDISTHELYLSDHGHTKATKKENIEWKVKASAFPVASINDIILKVPTTNVFDGRGGDMPRTLDGIVWTAKVEDNAVVGQKCDYSISWKDDDGFDHLYDPIISIKPSGISPILGIALFAGAVAAATVYFLLLYKKKKIKF